MSICLSWLARVSVCLAIAAPTLSAGAAFANGQFTERLFTAEDGSVYKIRQPAGAQVSEDDIQRAVAEKAADVADARAISSADKSVDPKDLACLTEALYYEARGEGTQGQKAVAEVILNRVDHPRFPKSVCGVVNQDGQFSYQGRVSKRYGEQSAYQRVKRVAMAALSGAPRDLTGGATYFHTGGVRPAWSRSFVKTTRIGSHIFYRNGGGQRLASN
ncbi:cell wall hydrolase [Paracoccus aminophilus]|uniref:Cell wall hydrolase n=1 Tax=Paracoccus aminophilus JCM 7686 TaxID=1367847 RepID=S5XQK8_PARAH|nr:cell wall hydrolase [Paracoccus aminophilus]AGT09669.1 cell wall hydrolase [Paracoccus aminophilus JCM 7686]